MTAKDNHTHKNNQTQPVTNATTANTEKASKSQQKPAGEKLQKALARCGLGSRRGMEKIIAEGRVTVNGQVASIGARVAAGDDIRIDDRKVRYMPDTLKTRRVILYYKPEGEICSAHDPEGRPTVFERLPKLSHDRWIMVGRLDLNSAGLLLFTNDGELANRLMHPSHEVVREYAVRVLGEVTADALKILQQGVMLEDGMAKFDHVKHVGGEGANQWYNVTLKEGRNREVRRLFASQELTVSRLLRIRYGSVILPSKLKSGRWIELENQDIDQLMLSVDLNTHPDAELYGMVKKRNKKTVQHKAERKRAERKYTKSVRKNRSAKG